MPARICTHDQGRVGIGIAQPPDQIRQGEDQDHRDQENLGDIHRQHPGLGTVGGWLCNPQRVDNGTSARRRATATFGMNTYARGWAPARGGTYHGRPPPGGSRAAQRASSEKPMSAKPTLSFWQIWNMCFGFLGIQFGFALQNANVSRIFQTLGAAMDENPLAMDRRAADRADRATDRRVLLRPHLDAPRPAPAVFPVGRPARGRGLAADAEFAGAVDGCRFAVGAGRVDQCIDGTVSRLRRRPAAGQPARARLCDAEFLHRHRRRGREPVALAAGQGRREQHRRARRDPRDGPLRLLRRAPWC